MLCLLAGATAADRRGHPGATGSPSSCWPGSPGRSRAPGPAVARPQPARPDRPGTRPAGPAHRDLVGARRPGLRPAVRLRRRHRGELGRRGAPRPQRRHARAARLPRRRGRRPDPRRGVPRPQPAPRRTPTASSRERPVGHRFEWLVPVLLVDAVFAVFVAAQLSVFFGGHDYVQRTTGLTYAEYVHQGFGQLTVATAADPARRVGRLALRRRHARRTGCGSGSRSALLCALTLVVVGSALYRMHLYQEAYGFTRLRLLVDLFEGWLGVLVLAVAVAGLVRWGVWLPRFALSPASSRCSGWPRSTPTPGSPSATSTGTPTPARSTGTTSATSPPTPCPCSTGAPRPRSCAGCRATGPRTTTGSRGTSAGAGRPTPSRTTRRR